MMGESFQPQSVFIFNRAKTRAHGKGGAQTMGKFSECLCVCFCLNSFSSLFPRLQDGAFLIRHSSAQSTRQPYTLAVLYQQKVYNIPIRFLEETHGYALGKEGKKNEEVRVKSGRVKRGELGCRERERQEYSFNYLSPFMSLSDFRQPRRNDFPPQE